MGETLFLKGFLLTYQVSEQFLISKGLLSPAFNLRFFQISERSDFLDFEDHVGELLLLRNAVLVGLLVSGIDGPAQVLLVIGAAHVEIAPVTVILRNMTQHVESRVLQVLLRAFTVRPWGWRGDFTRGGVADRCCGPGFGLRRLVSFDIVADGCDGIEVAHAFERTILISHHFNRRLWGTPPLG